MRFQAVLPDLASGLAATTLLAGATWRLLGLPASYVAVAAVIYLGMASLIVARLPTGHPGPGIGSANRVTLGRAALAVVVGALAVRFETLTLVGAWWVIAVSTAVLVLDGLDGRVARRTGTQTDFGARFDMELDAALIMALSVLVWASGKVGAWVLLIGLMRYLFVGAAWLWPALRGDLPESLRRKVVCVVQGIVLLVALGPIIPEIMAQVVVGAGLAALGYSFLVDVLWLVEVGSEG